MNTVIPQGSRRRKVILRFNRGIQELIQNHGLRIKGGIKESLRRT